MSLSIPTTVEVVLPWWWLKLMWSFYWLFSAQLLKLNCPASPRIGYSRTRTLPGRPSATTRKASRKSARRRSRRCSTRWRPRRSTRRRSRCRGRRSRSD